MKRINLLPWRETLKKEREKRFSIIIGIALLFTAGIWGAVHFYFVSQIEYQQSRNNYLKAEIKKAEDKIKEIEKLETERDNLIARMDAVQKLEEDRSKVVYLLDSVIDVIPPGLSLTTLSQKNNKVSIDGFAQSDARVASLIRAINESEWLSNPRLSVIQSRSTNSTRDIKNFKLSFDQLTPKQRKEKEAKEKEAKELEAKEKEAKEEDK